MIHSGRLSTANAPTVSTDRHTRAAVIIGAAVIILFAVVNLSPRKTAPTSYSSGAVPVMASSEDGSETRDAYLAPDSVWDYIENIIARLLLGEQ